ncbi:MAG TPA: prohibitin family protein [Bacteroidota bacterium]|nr:prohibitin family protein [Bacteroidota bacterium]
MIFLFFLIVGAAALMGWRAARRKEADQNNPAYRMGMTLSRAIGVIALLIAVAQCFTVIPAGHVGVVDFFGTVKDETLKAGINLVNPLARVVKMSVQTQEVKETMDTPSKEGLTTQIEVSVLYHLTPDRAAEVYKSVGESYVQVILEPQFRSVSRGVTALFEAKALYTADRGTLENLIFEDLKKLVEPRGITMESTPMRRVGLPAGLSASIEEKLRMEQESQRMQFVLQKESQEAERKRIEAGGIADFQKIVTAGISDNLLRWKGIEATLKIAESQNTKVVIVGSGKDGLPIILDAK